MGRKRDDLGPHVDARIKSLMRAGGTAEAIAEKLRDEGATVSRATIGRRMKELRGKVRVGRVSRSPASPKSPKIQRKPVQALAHVEAEANPVDPPLPSSVDAIPEGLSLETLQRLFVKADSAAQNALDREDLATFGAMGRLVTGLSEAIRKATPPDKKDPDERPDMIAAAARAREMLHRLIDRASGSE